MHNTTFIFSGNFDCGMEDPLSR